MHRKSRFLLVAAYVAIVGLLLVLATRPLLTTDSGLEGFNNGNSKVERITMQGYAIVDVYRLIDGRLVRTYHYESTNVMTNFGLVFLQKWLTGSTSGTFQWTPTLGGNNLYYAMSAPYRIALSTDSTPINATHSSWQDVDGSYPFNIEITSGGLARATGTVTINSAYTPGTGATKGSATYAISKSFTVEVGYSFAGVIKTGLFAGAYNTNSGATSSVPISGLIAENTFPSVDLQPGDQIAITWRITI